MITLMKFSIKIRWIDRNKKTKLMQSCKSPMTNIRTCVRVSKTSDKGENTPCNNTPLLYNGIPYQFKIPPSSSVSPHWTGNLQYHWSILIKHWFHVSGNISVIWSPHHNINLLNFNTLQKLSYAPFPAAVMDILICICAHEMFLISTWVSGPILRSKTRGHILLISMKTSSI